MSRRACLGIAWPLLLATGLLLPGGFATAAVPLPAWQRVELSRVPERTCQELRIARVGAGHLEVRFSSSRLEATGPDPKREGASLLVPAADPTRPSLVIYDESGPYARSAHVPPPLRWVLREGRLCVASGSTPILCGALSASPDRFVEIAFGPGWETDVTGCVEIASAGRARLPLVLVALLAALSVFVVVTARSVRERVVALVQGVGALSAMGAVFRPLALPGPEFVGFAGLLSAAIGSVSLLAPGRGRRFRRGLGLLAAATVAAVVAAPHPIATTAPAPPAASPLYSDAAYWQPQASQQSLWFRGRPVSELPSGREAWLVLGGSVTFGAGVAPDATFTAVAEGLLHAAGRPVDLYNAGAEGWNLQAIDRWLQDMGDALPFQGIVLVSILNNATLPIPGPRPTGCDATLMSAFGCNRWRSMFFLRWPKVLVPKRHNAERHEALLRGLLEREIGLGRQVVLVDEPSEAQIEGGVFRWFGAESYRATSRSVAAEFGLTLHPVADALATLPRGEAFLDGIHPTEAGHRIFGQRLSAILIDGGFVGDRVEPLSPPAPRR